MLWYVRYLLREEVAESVSKSVSESVSSEAAAEASAESSTSAAAILRAAHERLSPDEAAQRPARQELVVEQEATLLVRYAAARHAQR